MNKKYSNFLTILLVVVIIAIVAIIGYLGYRYYETYIIKSSSEDFVDNFGDSNQNGKNNNTTKDNNTTDIDNSVFDGIDKGNTTGGNSSSGNNAKKYNGFLTAGTIEIPSTKLKAPILDESEYSPKALETSVVVLYGVGLNKPGNTTIAGHNYRRSGVFFSDNKKISNGDKIYITDLSGKRVTYTVYDKFEVAENDEDYMSRDTNGATEISLTTCTDDSKARLIILARADA